MLLKIYYAISVLLIPFTGFYIRRRIKLDKEDPNRFKERYGKASVVREDGNLVWIHAASVGESLSILPIINKLENTKSISQILLTTGTTSAAKIVMKKLSSKTVHQYLPLDTPLFNARFLKHWKPAYAIFVESEIWPNLILQIKQMKIKLAIINGRMTLNSYNKWLRFKKSSELIFKSFDLCLTQNQESSFFYKKLGINNTYYTGNLKFSSNKFEVKEDAYNELKKMFKGRKVFLAASTHLGEEKMISEITNKIRELKQEFITIIVPRHPNRSKLLDQMSNSKVVIRSANGQIDQSTDIYLADTFGELGMFYKLADFIFIGGSFVPHGGQNPIEAAYFCNNIFHGKYVENFLEVYETLGHLSITELVDNSRQLQVKLMKCYDAPSPDEDELMKKINLEASDILKDTMHHLNSNIFNNDL